MTNLLRRCENCVNAVAKYIEDNDMLCEPRMPYWVENLYIPREHRGKFNYIVPNVAAEECKAFRLRDIGENHNV